MALDAPAIKLLFNELRGENLDRFPAPESLSSSLARLASPGPVTIHRREATLFVTASIEMWNRAVHSLVVAASTMRSSKIWSSVSGYYASHYIMRAFAHLFGFFALYRQKKYWETSFSHGAFTCSAVKGLKQGEKKEHTFYWLHAFRRPEFAGETPLFSENDDRLVPSDSSHRGYASYIDHLGNFVPVVPMTEVQLKTAIIDIAKTFEDAPLELPNRSQKPLDVATVLGLAYRRIARYREFLDSLLGLRNRYWTAHRTPIWCRGVVGFPPKVG